MTNKTNRVLRYLSHPQVEQDPDIEVMRWHLSAVGRQRVNSLGKPEVLAATSAIVSSAETKATDTAEILAAVLGLEIEVRARMHENDRSATGYLPPDIFEATANQFFAHPGQSIRGWERALDAQQRIVSETEAVIEKYPQGDLLLIGHGGVGTLLYCHYAGVSIDRQYDQPPNGGGNVIAIDITTKTVIHGWRPMEDVLI
ncbi:MAG: histidine phosphatase family protein [Thiolinea sp.]